MVDTTKFEELAQKTYARFGKLAKAYHYGFSRTAVTKNGVPCMIFLGNHSSGKSSLINWLVGGDPVQDVGLAPTDDGFTILTYGETDEDICGPAAVAKRQNVYFFTSNIWMWSSQTFPVAVRRTKAA